MFRFILFSLFLSVILSAEFNPCAPNWHYFNETGCCYKTTSDIGTWFQGSEMCAKMQPGAKLASLGSEAESKFVVTKHKNGIDGIHAWTGLSQTQQSNNWTFTDGSKPWSSFFGPVYLLHNHTSCVEIVDNWLVELFQNSGKTQPTFCYHLLQSLCKYCPVPPVATTPKVAKQPAAVTVLPVLPHAVKIEKAHPRSNPLEGAPDCPSNPSATTVKPVASSAPTAKTVTLSNIIPASLPVKTLPTKPTPTSTPTKPVIRGPIVSSPTLTTRSIPPVTATPSTIPRTLSTTRLITLTSKNTTSTARPVTSSTKRVHFQPIPSSTVPPHICILGKLEDIVKKS